MGSTDGPMTAVVGYDGSATARAAVELAARHAGEGGTLHVIYVASPPSEWQGEPYYQQTIRHHREHGTKVLATVAELDTGDARIETEIIDGHTAQVLMDVAWSRRADEIVVGTRGHGPLRGLGSVSHALLHNATCPVVVVPPQAVEEQDRGG